MRLHPTIGDRIRSLLGAAPKPDPKMGRPRARYVVRAYHKQTETNHGPFDCEADAATWARANLKFTAMYGWEIEPLYGPDEGGMPVQQEAAQ